MKSAALRVNGLDIIINDELVLGYEGSDRRTNGGFPINLEKWQTYEFQVPGRNIFYLGETMPLRDFYAKKSAADVKILEYTHFESYGIWTKGKYVVQNCEERVR